VLRAAHHGGEQIRPAGEESSVLVLEHVGRAWTLGELVLSELPREGPHLVVLKVLRVHEKKKIPHHAQTNDIYPPRPMAQQTVQTRNVRAKSDRRSGAQLSSQCFFIFIFIIIVLWKCAPWAGRALRTR
jgi:hypothetical protein